MLGPRGMQGLRHRRWTQRAAAIPVALVMWFASLSPLAAQWLTSSVASACCRTKCCCHRAKTKTDGPAISGTSCASGCTVSAFSPVAAAVWAPSVHRAAHAAAADRILTIETAEAIHTSNPQLWQRPPPTQ
jgi:hypothetical protein